MLRRWRRRPRRCRSTRVGNRCTLLQCRRGEDHLQGRQCRWPLQRHFVSSLSKLRFGSYACSKHTMARPRSSTKKTSPIKAGATVSEAPPPIAWKTLAARTELYEVATAHHIVHTVIMTVEASRTGLLPMMLDNGTHQMFDAPRNKVLIYNVKLMLVDRTFCHRLQDRGTTYGDEVSQVAKRSVVRGELLEPELKRRSDAGTGEVSGKRVEADGQEKPKLAPCWPVERVGRVF